ASAGVGSRQSAVGNGCNHDSLLPTVDCPDLRRGGAQRAHVRFFGVQGGGVEAAEGAAEGEEQRREEDQQQAAAADRKAHAVMLAAINRPCLRALPRLAAIAAPASPPTPAIVCKRPSPTAPTRQTSTANTGSRFWCGIASSIGTVPASISTSSRRLPPMYVRP